MVLQRRLDYGFNGYQVPPTPRAPRSTRRRCSFKKKSGETQLCAFDLLATVAGKLLLEEGDNFPSAATSLENGKCTDFSSTEAERQSAVEPCDTGNLSLDCDTRSKMDAVSGLVSAVTSDISNKVDCVESLPFCKENYDSGGSLSKVETIYSESRWLCEDKLENGTARNTEVEPLNSSKIDAATYNSEGSKNGIPSGQISSNSGSRDNLPCVPFPPCLEDVNIVSKDDDENSSWCSQPSTVTKFLRPPTRVRDRRIRKLLASRYWNISPKLKDGEVSFSNGGSYGRRSCFKSQRSQRIFPFKKRKYKYQSSLSHFNGDSLRSGPQRHRATRTSSSSVVGQKTSFQRRDSYVKLRIKSFRVPELFIEIPETATVGTLKRTVMETVSAILDGGLCVGVLLQGKKVRDDNKTLLQTGISHENQLDALGFSLEPNTQMTPEPLYTRNSALLPSEEPLPLIRYSPPLPADPHAIITDTPTSSLGNFVDSDNDSAPSFADMSIEKSVTDSRAIVPVPSMNPEALSAVSLCQKPTYSEVSQRRIRRPFSVSEVEALVQAVEKLGTGRWRDVKLRAFDNAKHRTYVDLKDKWKTLVHTARISPQQRRGEPVPQELLDRVLSAHAYWTQQQAKHQLHLKHPTETVVVGH